jgi:hypothetical protein
MQLKKAIAAVVLGLGVATFAQANFVNDLGVLDFDSPLSYTSGTSPAASGQFDDWFTFTVANDVLAADTTAKVVMFNGSVGFDVEDLQIAVYKGSYTNNNLNGLVDGSYELLDSFAVTGSGLTVSGTFTFDPTVTAYTFLISGKTTGGSATYSFGLTAAPVPEPAEYAMLLAGLGLVGVVARRRKV